MMSQGGFSRLAAAALITLGLAAAQSGGRPSSLSACGQVIKTDTILDADLSCPPETDSGIIIGASNIILDLGGHVLSGYNPSQ
jgi:hypothetical protein